MVRKFDVARRNRLGTTLTSWIVAIVILLLIVAGLLYYRSSETPQSGTAVTTPAPAAPSTDNKSPSATTTGTPQNKPAGTSMGT